MISKYNFNKDTRGEKLGEYKVDVLTTNREIIDSKGNILFNPLRKYLAIEILDSKISSTNVYEIVSNYNSYKADVIFILDLNNYKYKITQEILYKTNRYIVDVTGNGGGIIRSLKLNIGANILLDSGNRNLFYIKNYRDERLEVSRISKRSFLEQLDEELDEELENDNIEVIDLVIKENEIKIDKYISLMDKDIPKMYDKNEKGDNGFMILGEVLSILSSGDEIIMEIWINWLLNKYNMYINVLERMRTINSSNKTIPNVYMEPLKKRYRNHINNYTAEYFDNKYL